MNKDTLVNIIASLKITSNEGANKVESEGSYPRIVYWDYMWEDVVASNESFVEVETYQVSFFSKMPRDPKMLELREKLREIGIHPLFNTEYIQDKNEWHTFFSLEVDIDE